MHEVCGGASTQPQRLLPPRDQGTAYTMLSWRLQKAGERNERSPSRKTTS